MNTNHLILQGTIKDNKMKIFMILLILWSLTTLNLTTFLLSIVIAVVMLYIFRDNTVKSKKIDYL